VEAGLKPDDAAPRGHDSRRAKDWGEKDLGTVEPGTLADLVRIFATSGGSTAR
jgi:hypothetical protein